MAQKEISKRSEDYAQWYLDVIKEADLADYAPVKGCMVIKPYGYAIWERIQHLLDTKFKETGVENAYFPLLIPESYLKKEADHVEGFAPELAVVTHAGGEKLAEPLVIRPTSETIIYEMFSKWISSYRDLPLVINQWANVVRWEKRTRLFLRTSEFLWQEGHTAHATSEEAYDRSKQMQGVYQAFSEDFMAIPVVPGTKTESERFAGAEVTYTIESMMQDGKALQTGTSHVLSDHFTQAFNIKFLDADGKEKFIRATSWGVSTRLIGALIMAHSDDNGLVLPPNMAPIQVVIIPISINDEDKKQTEDKADQVAAELEKLGLRVKVDKRDGRIGSKFYEWEKKGVPVRLEIGPKDIAAKSMVMVRRDDMSKETLPESDAVKIKTVLDEIQQNLYQRALKFRDENTKDVATFDELVKQIDGGFAYIGWCGDVACEDKIKAEKGTIRCIPFEQPKELGQCAVCGKKKAVQRALVAKAY